MKLRRAVLLGLWILSLIAISFYGGAISYGFFFATTLLPFVCLVYLIFVYVRFRIFQKVENRNMVCGQPVPYYFVLQNDDFFAFAGIRIRFFSSFSEVEKLPENPEYELLPGDRYTYQTRIICKYRGEYEVGVKEVEITDFLRLFRMHYKVPGTIKAVVLPKITEMKELQSIREINAFMQRESATADTEPDRVVRDYVRGDALKQIHWKATAKTRSLKVRGRIGEEKQGIAIFCDTKRYSEKIEEYLPVENKILETVLALGIYLAKREAFFDVYLGNDRVTQTRVSGMRDFERFYQGTSEISFSPDNALSRALLSATERGMLILCKLIICVLHEIDLQILHITEELTRNGHFVVLYVVTTEDIGEIIRQSSERRRIILIPTESELEGRL